jgi:hypothetical protein
MSVGEEAKRSSPKSRSPSYPGIDLGTALQRAEEMYKEERTHPAHIDAILKHWGYKPKVGPGLVTFAALKKYGLLIDEGSGDNRRGRLTDLALRIIQDQRSNSQERLRAIQEAALMPAIHRELWETYAGTLPSDDSLRYALLRDRNFTERGATEFIGVFKSTIAFARLGEGDMEWGAGDEADEKTSRERGIDRGKTTGLLDPPVDPQARTVQIPLGGGRWATLQAPFPFSEQDWNLMLSVLQAMKPGLVAEPSIPPITLEALEGEKSSGEA